MGLEGNQLRLIRDAQSCYKLPLEAPEVNVCLSPVTSLVYGPVDY